MSTTPTEEVCAACGRKLRNVIAHQVWTGTRLYQYCPGHCPGETCTTKK